MIYEPLWSTTDVDAAFEEFNSI